MAVVKIHPTWFERVADGPAHLSPLERMILLLKQDDPSICDHDAMAMIADAQRAFNWGGLKLANHNWDVV